MIFESGQINDEEMFVYQVRVIVKAQINDRNLNIIDVAERFHMSVRTFQRRLVDDGYNFRDIIDDVRKSLAIELVCQDKYSCQETAERVGYSESTSFLRSFKRWFGCTPARYRAMYHFRYSDAG